MTGIELEEVHRTLLSCFDASSFAMFLQMRMDQRLDEIAGPGPFRDVVFNVLLTAEREGWDALLIVRAADYLPLRQDLKALAGKYARTLVAQVPVSADNRAVRMAYREFGLAPEGFPAENFRGGLEKVIVPENGFLNFPVWVERAFRCQAAVGRIEVDGEPMGTAFLVGANAALTNHHVLQHAMNGTDLARKVAVRFDYKQLRDGTILSGTLITIRKVLDHSPPTDGELAGDPERYDPTNNQLDYALLKTEGNPGDEPIRVPDAAAEGPRRGWIPLPATGVVIEPDPYAADMPALIAQHPLGQPLSLAIEWRSMIGLNGSATRVRYQTNTQAGSSGSPTFDRNWNLIALHHYGDAKYSHRPRFNQGVPIAAIRRRIAAQGQAGALGGDVN